MHAGGPGGLVLGGILAILLGNYGVDAWRVKILLLAVPAVIDIIMLLPVKFPVNACIAAGVSYRDMIREVGGLGLFIVTWMILAEVLRVAGVANPVGMLGVGVLGAMLLGNT